MTKNRHENLYMLAALLATHEHEVGKRPDAALLPLSDRQQRLLSGVLGETALGPMNIDTPPPASGPTNVIPLFEQ